jgi:RimJ/RimL family protein N-acetyltransferase
VTLAFSIPTLTTERLILRAPCEADVPAIYAFGAGSRSAFLGGPLDRFTLWRGFLANIGLWALRGYGFYSVDTRAGEFVGRVGVIRHEGWPEAELAWHLFDGFEGRGFAFEAAQAAQADYHARISPAPLISMIDPGNTRSQALARRLGARLERTDAGDGKPVEIHRHTPPRVETQARPLQDATKTPEPSL